MANKRQHNDVEAYEYNARRYVKTVGILADEALHDLAELERSRHVRFLTACYLLGSLAVICAPLTMVGLIVPAGLTLLAIEGIKLRLRQRLADIEALSISHDQDDMQVSLRNADQPADQPVKILAQKGGKDD